LNKWRRLVSHSKKGDFDDMRFSLATAGSAVVIAALLAGCSNSPQGSQSLPSSGVTSSGHSVGAPQFIPQGKLTPLQLLKLQAEGKMPGPVPIKVLQRQLKQLQAHPTVHINVHKNKGGVAIWSSLTGYNFLLGSNKKGTSVTAAINTYTNGGCETPISVKVDHSQNIWAGCEYNTTTNETGPTEYNSSGTEVAQYQANCPESGSYSCTYDYGYGFDEASNASNVFASMTFFEYDECTPYPTCSYVYGAGFEYWPAGSPSTTPKLITEPYGPVYDNYYMDLDSSGNIWFDYYGCPSSGCGYGIGEITNPTTSPAMVVIENPGYLQFAGGVYASNGGNTINVIDQTTHMITQFNTSGTKTGTLGPTAFGIGDPVTGSFNSTDSNMVIGDADDWLDIGTVSTNKWKVAKAALDISTIEGAAYTPSDK
jgi:hypothetical protein